MTSSERTPHSELVSILRDALDALRSSEREFSTGAKYDASIEEAMAPRYAALDRLEEQLEAFREFFDAHWMVDKGVTDFDLHGEAVERLHRAFNAVYAFHSPEPSPATDPLGYIELDEHGMCPHDYAKGLGCHVCDPASVPSVWTDPDTIGAAPEGNDGDGGTE